MTDPLDPRGLFADKLIFREEHRQGYGAADAYYVRAIYNNRLIEEVVCGSAHAQGATLERLRHKYATANLEVISKDKPIASSICDVCGLPTLDIGASYVCDKTVCHRPDCKVTIPALIQASKDAASERERQRADKRRREDEERLRDLEDGFHWQDGWFFKRVDDGAVRVVKVEHDKAYACVHAIIPEPEWASIVASVSAGGETGESWQHARRFHAADALERLAASRENASPNLMRLNTLEFRNRTDIHDALGAFAHKVLAATLGKEHTVLTDAVWYDSNGRTLIDAVFLAAEAVASPRRENASAPLRALVEKWREAHRRARRPWECAPSSVCADELERALASEPTEEKR